MKDQQAIHDELVEDNLTDLDKHMARIGINNAINQLNLEINLEKRALERYGYRFDIST